MSFTHKVWHSPTLMTWGNLGSRLLGFLILVPLALRHLSVEEANLWFLFQAVLALQTMADFGFTPTFVRVVSYARAGVVDASATLVEPKPLVVDEHSVRRVIGTMRRIYNRLSLIAILLLVFIGSLAMIKPIAQLEAEQLGWWAWAIVAVSGTLVFRGGVYSTYMQGAEQIALYQRWEIVTGLLSVIGGIAALSFGGGLLLLVATLQGGALIGVLVTRRLAIQHAPPNAWSETPVIDREIMDVVWPAAWRSGLGVSMTFGIVQGIGIGYAQVAAPAQSAAFLLAQRIIRTLSSFANAPFYTRLPNMSRLYAENKRAELVENARTGMLYANWVLLAGILAIGFTADLLLALIGSKTPFVPLQVWWLLGLATLVERIGAMHLQLYSTTNNIVWHVAASITGAIMIVAVPIAFHFLGVVGLPLGILAAYALFFAPFCLTHSYTTFRMRPLHMDGLASVVPIALLATISLMYFN